MAALTVSEFQHRLEQISEYDGVAFGRLRLISEEEQKHDLSASKFKGYLALSNAFKCFFLESVEILNRDIRPKVSTPLSEFYPQFLPRLSQAFRTLCGSEKISIAGYPYHGYILLRNEFDNLVLVSAALQGFTDFYTILGIHPDNSYDEKKAKRIRKNNEYEMKRLMMGTKSGLAPDTVEQLGKIDEMFDFETHGAKLSLTGSMDFMKGNAPLPILPRYEEKVSGLFMNRYCEVAWMMHKLVPMIQPPEMSLGQDWKSKWIVVDESFRYIVESLTRENQLPIGDALVEFIDKKFPFNESSTFPL